LDNTVYQQSVEEEPHKIIQLLYIHLLKNLKKMKKYIDIINEIEYDLSQEEFIILKQEHEQELSKSSQVSNEIILELISTLKSSSVETEEFVRYMTGMYLHQLKELNLSYVEMTSYKINNIYSFFNECNQAWKIIIEEKGI